MSQVRVLLAALFLFFASDFSEYDGFCYFCPQKDTFKYEYAKYVMFFCKGTKFLSGGRILCNPFFRTYSRSIGPVA